MSLSCLIVDDESMSRLSLKKLCEKVPNMEVKAICQNGTEALSILQEEEVDLVFLDIHMPDLTGIDLVKSLDTLPQIVFTTTDREFALEAYSYNVTDYLIKPIRFPRLLKAVEKARKMASLQKSEEEQSPSSQEADSIFIKAVDNRLVKLNLNDIQFAEAMGDYALLYTEAKRHTVHTTMKKLEAKLPSDRFLKVHRKYIVNLDQIIDLQDNSLLIGKKVIPVSRANRESLMSRLNLL
ncbi:MAG: LytTR family DNA-binding domain-containing protein [Bacteroidota bacterium]